MCGIVGITGGTDVAANLLEGLRRLEYRGYDSAGIAVQQGGAIVSVQRYETDKERFRVPAKVELEQIFFAADGDQAADSQTRRVAQGLVDRVREGSDLRAEVTLAGAEIQELGAIPV